MDRPLQGKDTIRLLTFREQCPHTGDMLSLAMHRSLVSDKYIALSYEWGQREPDDPIILVNNRQVQVRKNLYGAIRQIFKHYSRYLEHRREFQCAHRRKAVHEPALQGRRFFIPSYMRDRCCDHVVDDWTHRSVCGDRPGEDCYEKALGPWTSLEDNSFWAEHDPPQLWIDALCINQSHKWEKGGQVRMMGTIFNSATMVLSWLGLPQDGSDDALRILSMPSEQLPQFMATDGFTDQLKDAIVSFCERTYWRRVWILQELILAQKYVVMCGAGSVTSESLDGALACFSQQAQPIDTRKARESYQGIVTSAANEIVLSKRLASFCTLSRWLRLCLEANYQATVPHDYLYALFSISSDNVKASIEVRYNKPIVDIYRQLLESLVEDPTSRLNRDWLLGLSQKMGLSHQEGIALLNSEYLRRHGDLGELFTGAGSEPEVDLESETESWPESLNLSGEEVTTLEEG